MNTITVAEFPERYIEVIPKLGGVSLNKEERDKQLKKYHKDSEDFFESLENFIKTIIKKDAQDEYTGKLVKRPAADSYAFYAVINKNLIVHIPYGDCWEAPEVYAWTTEDLTSYLQGVEELEKHFLK